MRLECHDSVCYVSNRKYVERNKEPVHLSLFIRVTGSFRCTTKRV